MYLLILHKYSIWETNTGGKIYWGWNTIEVQWTFDYPDPFGHNKFPGVRISEMVRITEITVCGHMYYQKVLIL